MRLFLDNYLRYITICPSAVKVLESACEALFLVVEREKRCRHYPRYLSRFATIASNNLHYFDSLNELEQYVKQELPQPLN
jgi:hypothetical protein